MRILAMLPWPFKKIALHQMCVVLRIVCLRCKSAPTSPTSSASKYKSKSKVKSSNSILKKHVVESQRLQDKMETLLSERDTSPDSLVQFGLIPCIGEMMMINLMDDASV